jgi:signal transduction histidine kinase
LFKIIEFGDGYVASDLTSVNLKKMLDSIFKSFEELVFRKKLQVVIDVADDFNVHVDESSFKYAILNLVDNAITYSNDEGEIKITATNTAETSSITIEDTGIGIPVEDQVFIFDKFFRAKNSYLKKTVGTGLGLSIVKIVAEGHDGEVSFASKEGEGTTFTLLLPEKR